MTDPDDVLARDTAFDKKLAASGMPTIGDLAKDFRRLHRTSRALVAIACLLVVTVVAVVLLAVRANEAASKAVRAQNAVVVTCNGGNAARAAELAVWNYVLSLPPQVPRTTAQIAEVTQFKTYLDLTLAPRDCTKLAGT
jgi:hypothetical protein